MLNIVLILFLGFMIYWWGNQGIFSALIHLVLTILAGVIALAFWESIVYGSLISMLPESAWAIGLLAPFGVALIALRYVFDYAVPGNLDFHNMAQRVVGGFLGFLSGVLTFGLLLIGLQFSGISSVLGYNGFNVNDAGEIERTGGLVLPVDTITSGFFSQLSAGAFSPVLTATPLQRYHPQLAVESSLYHQAAFEPSRRGLQPANVTLPDETPFIQLRSELPPTLKARLKQVDPNAQTVIVGTDVALQVADRRGAADSDATFRIARHQVALVYDEDGRTAQRFPLGYVQNGEFRDIQRSGAWAYSAPSVAHAKFYWIFDLPADAAPRFVRVKQTRVPLPDQPIEDPAVADGLISYTGDALAGTNGNGSTGPILGGSSGFVSVNASTPWVINRNLLNSEGVTTDGDAIISGRGMISRERGSPGVNLSVNRIHSTKNAAIVKVNLGKQKEANSLLGKIFDLATSQTQAPVLVSSTGQKFFAIGYGIVGRSRWIFSIDHNQTIRALSQIDRLGSATGDDDVVLYYQIPNGVSLVKFELGPQTSRSIDPPVKVQ